METNSATNITADSATLNGRMTKCFGKITEYGFDYGTDPESSIEVIVGTDEYVAIPFSHIISGLKPGVYYYRAFATNSSDTGYGRMATFTIRPSGINDDILVNFDGEFVNFEVQPVIDNGRTLVPLRAICEALGADVQWDGDTQTITILKEKIKVTLVVGGEAHINGKLAPLDAPARIINDRTLVPLRFISQAMGCTVDWDNAARVVIITSY